LRKLRGREHAVGNGDAQHRAVPLDVEAILQAQRTQLVDRQLAGQMTAIWSRYWATRSLMICWSVLS
jgi:hypothetical protein